MSGDVYVGPTAIPAFGRENYGLLQGISSEALRIMKDITLMYIANQQHFRALMHSEMKKYIKSYFIQSARKLISAVDANDLQSSNKVGIRPQLINLAKRKIEMDYIVEQDESSMHVLNAISPAFTGSLRFAELLVDRMQNNVEEKIAING
jgi:L-2-hydroxyglutarate oxidase